MQLPGHNPVWTQIKCSQLVEHFQGQWSQYLALQKAGLLTDITLHMKDGIISLHQAVMIPMSNLLLSMTDTPLVMFLPDYDLSTAQSMVSLLYTGSCIHQSSPSYFSLLSMLASLSINLSPSSLVLCAPDHYNHKKFRVGTVSNDVSFCGSPDLVGGERPCKEENESQSCKSDKGLNGIRDPRNACFGQRLVSEDAKISVEVLCSDCGSVSCQCPGNEDSDSFLHFVRTEGEEFNNSEQTKQNKVTLKLFEEQLKLPKFNIKHRGNDGEELRPPASISVVQIGGNCCPVCGVHVAGGMSKYRAHLVEKHFYKEMSTMLGTRFNKQCPVCEKTIELRGNLVKHLGIVHKYVDQMINVDINQNSTNSNTNNVDDMEDPPKLVIDDDFKEDDEPFSAGDLESQLPSPANQFSCTICRCSRKTEFRLLQHYSVAHFRTNLEEQFGLQFVTSNGCCPVCRKVMKNLYCFLIHIGAAHGEVSQYLEEQQQQESSNIQPLNNNIWFCPVEGCKTAKYSNKCFLMKHFATKHYSQQLSAILQPLYEASASCEACGKKFSSFQQFLVHCSVTHRMVLAYCSQVELDSLEGQVDVKHCVGRVRRVQGYKSFPCQLCGKAFINNYLLRKHYTARHFYDALKSDFVSSISSGVCEKCGQEHSGSRMVQHLGVSHNQVDSYVEGLSREVVEPEVILDCE